MSGRRKGELVHRIETPETWTPPLETEQTPSGLYVPARSMGQNYSPTILSPNAFKAGFAALGDTNRGRRSVGELGTDPNWDVLQRQPAIQRMATHIRGAYMASLSTKGKTGEGENLYREGRGLYDQRKAELTRMGEKFNENRAKRGLPTYFDNDLAVAGLALTHLYGHMGHPATNPSTMMSYDPEKQEVETGELHKDNTPKMRPETKDEALARVFKSTPTGASLHKTLETGLINPNPRRFRINEGMANAIEQGTHPMDVLAQQQGGHGGLAYDLGGATLDQGNWRGEWGGVQRGAGYPITPSQHDLARGVHYGMTDRGISGNSPTAIRRYMAFQSAHMLAQHGPGGIVETVGRRDSPARFQAITNLPWNEMMRRTNQGRVR